MALLEAHEVEVTFETGPLWRRRRTAALAGVSLAIDEGEIVGVVGESGSGKSTLGGVLLGLLAPRRGEVRYRGRTLGSMSRKERMGRFAAVLQHPKWSLDPMLSVRASVLEPLSIRGGVGTAAEARRLAGEMLERVGLPGAYQDRRPHELSGGQRQRVSIARALTTAPEFVLFDEAVSALDVSVQAQVLNLIRTLQRDAGFSALFISHDLAATRYVASRIAVMDRGRVVEDAPAVRFYGLAEHPRSRELQAASGLIPASEIRPL